MDSRENSAHRMSPQAATDNGAGAHQNAKEAGANSGSGAVENGTSTKPIASTTLDVFLSSLPPGSAAAPALATPSPVKAPLAAISTGGAPRSPAPSSTSGGAKKRTRGRQAQPSRSRRRRSGSEEWTPPRVDGEAVSGPRAAAVAASSGPEDSVEGAPAATGGNFQKGCGNPVVQVSRDLKQSFDTHISEQLRQCTVSVTEGGPEHAPVLGRVLQLACMALREMLDKNVVTAAHVRTQFGDFQAEHRARQSSPTKKQAQRRIGVRMPTDVLPLIVDTLGILSAARLWGANRMLIEFMFLCCIGRIPGIPMLVTPEVVVSATTGGPFVTAAVSGATQADSSVSNARAQAGRSTSVCGKGQDSAPGSPRSPRAVSQAGLKGLAKAAVETVARATDPGASAQPRIFRDSTQANKDAATIAAMAAGGGFHGSGGLQPFPGAGNPFQQSQLAPGDSTFRCFGDAGNAGFQGRSPLSLVGTPLAHPAFRTRSPSPYGGSDAAEHAAGTVRAGAAGGAGGGGHTHVSPRAQSVGDVRHHAADRGHSRGPLRSTTSAGTAIHSRIAAAATAATNALTQSTDGTPHTLEDIYTRHCLSEPTNAYPTHSTDYTGTGHGTSLPPTPTSLGSNPRDNLASCSSAPFAFSARSSAFPSTSLNPAISTSTATNMQGMLHGHLMMPKANGACFPVAQQPGQPLRSMASLYREVNADGRASASESMAAVGCTLDVQGTDASTYTAPETAAYTSVGGMSMSEGAPVLFKEDTLKTLQREAAHLGSTKPTGSEPSASQCSDHMKSSGFASGAVEQNACRADCSIANMAPSAPSTQAEDANNANVEPAWFMDKLSKQPTLSVMCSEVPGSWDPLMAFPVEIAKEGSGEHNAPREATVHLQPHSNGPSASGGTSTPALRIEVLNTGLKDTPSDSKRISSASGGGDKHAAVLRGALRSAKSAPGPSGKGSSAENKGLKRSGESCMADVFASLNAQSHAFSSDDTATAAGDGSMQLNNGLEPALAEGSPGNIDDNEHWPALGQDISFAVPDVLERSGDFGTKPLKALVSSGLWKMDTADMRTLELDMAAMDKSASEAERDMDANLDARMGSRLASVTAD